MDQRQKYSKEFKVEAVRRVVEDKQEATQVARELDLHPNLLHKWKKQYLAEAEQAFPGNGRSRGSQSEVEQLRRELERVTMERDILKKAVGIFSQIRR